MSKKNIAALVEKLEELHEEVIVPEEKVLEEDEPLKAELEEV